jgi:hypothetical protein
LIAQSVALRINNPSASVSFTWGAKDFFAPIAYFAGLLTRRRSNASAIIVPNGRK